VYCRFLFQYLARPVDLLRRMWEAVRLGGVLAVEDADLEGLFCDPDNDGFSFYRRIYAEVLARNGGDPAAPAGWRGTSARSGSPIRRCACCRESAPTGTPR
jgi:hypothetical protein